MKSLCTVHQVRSRVAQTVKRNLCTRFWRLGDRSKSHYVLKHEKPVHCAPGQVQGCRVVGGRVQQVAGAGQVDIVIED